MGRVVFAGLVTEQIIGGQSFVRLDVPAMGEQPAFTKFFGSGAIYCITPCDQTTARIAVERLGSRPIDLWKLQLPELPSSKLYDSDDSDDLENDDPEGDL
jgi:hypothetical protein